MNYWIFIATQKEIDGGIVTAKEILTRRLSDGFWGLGKNAPNRNYLQKGDQIVFYLGAPIMEFAAAATLASDFFSLSHEQKREYWHGKAYETEVGVLLEKAQLWDTPRQVKDLVSRLKFIENKSNWFAYFRGSVRRILEDDYRTIIDNRGVVPVETKRIEVINPRRVAVSLRCTKKGAAYQVDICLRSFLASRGWTLQKSGKSYAIMSPPSGTEAPFLFTVEIPNQDQVMAIAQEMHAVRKPWAGNFGEWAAFYNPPQSITSTMVDPFTAQPISEPKHDGTSPASFFVGVRLFWHADVLFGAGGTSYYESESQPIQPKDAATFGSPDELPLNELGDSTLIADIKEIESKQIANPTMVKALVDARLGQGKFAFQVRQLWNDRCSVTGSSTKSALEAAHIRAWSHSSDTQRLDPNNGLLLTANLHRLFDAGLISFADSGKMLVSSKLSRSEQEIFGLIGKMLSKKPSAEAANYLSYHRARFVE